jgi:hypothetical protein
MASNSGDSSASRSQVLLSQPPVQNSTLLTQLQRHLSSTSLAEFNSQPNYKTISSFFAFASCFLVTNLNNKDSPASVLTSLLSGEYPATELTQPAWGPRWAASERTQQKTPFPTVLYCCYGCSPSDSPDIVDVFTGRYQATYVPSRDRCIATILDAAIC